jgi:hypothetical protein
MPQSGYTPIILFSSTTAGNQPTTSNLNIGELALNVADGKLYFNKSGTITVLALASTAVAYGTGVATALGQNVTGSGGIVLATSPTISSPSLTTPTLGVASATTINKVTLTAPATGSTLTIANGKTLTANNSITLAGVDAKTLTVNISITLAGTDSTTMTFPPASASVGYLNVPMNNSPTGQSANYTAVAADSGKFIFHPSTDANARTFTIPSNASVPYDIGTVLSFVNMTSQFVTIAIATDTMYLAVTGTTGNRTLQQYSIATAIKMTATTWLISGSGLT